ncbi:MAG: PIG-L family deacetylase [Flavobacteriales bacterium]|nr:PIG-L family deacetylase [Flavobacteriales bacterium]
MKTSALNAFDTVLVLAPHTDDGELGCGGTIHKLLSLGKKVIYVAFSTCEESVPEGFPSDVLSHEVKAATSTLGILSEDLVILDFKVRYFPRDRQEILESMVRLNKEYKPDLVFCPSSYDIHQDHGTVSMEAKRAFKNTTLLGYEFIWNNFQFASQCFIELNESDVAKKVAAMECYKSQSKRLYAKDKLIRGVANYRGLQANVEFAEAFEVIRWII